MSLAPGPLDWDSPSTMMSKSRLSTPLTASLNETEKSTVSRLVGEAVARAMAVTDGAVASMVSSPALLSLSVKPTASVAKAMTS